MVLSWQKFDSLCSGLFDVRCKDHLEVFFTLLGFSVFLAYLATVLFGL